MEERLETLLEILERDDYEEILNNRINQITRMNNSIILRSFIRQSKQKVEKVKIVKKVEIVKKV